MTYSSAPSCFGCDLRLIAEDEHAAFREKHVTHVLVSLHGWPSLPYKARKELMAFANSEALNSISTGLHYQICKIRLMRPTQLKGELQSRQKEQGFEGRAEQKSWRGVNSTQSQLSLLPLRHTSASCSKKAPPQASAIWGGYSLSAEPQTNHLILLGLWWKM